MSVAVGLMASIYAVGACESREPRGFRDRDQHHSGDAPRGWRDDRHEISLNVHRP